MCILSCCSVGLDLFNNQNDSEILPNSEIISEAWSAMP